MKVAGFTFIKDAIIYDYPIVEAICSILPICDEFIVAVGRSSDDTLALIKSINSSKIRIIETIWNDELREGGRILATETDKALKSIGLDVDWCFYIQGDEVVHEAHLSIIKKGIELHLNNPKVEGLLFNYHHFYGSYDYIASSSSWYQHEIRILKNNPTLYSYRDAQGFRKGQNQKIKVKALDAWIYHYCWVKAPQVMMKKQRNFNKYWHDDKWIKDKVGQAAEFDYSGIDQLERFKGTHPVLMQKRIAQKNWTFDHDITKNKRSLKEKGKGILKALGWNTSFHNYRII